MSAVPAWRGVCAAGLALALAGCASSYFRPAQEPAPAARYSPALLPHKDLWSGVIFNGNKVGFSHLRVEPLSERGQYRLTSEAAIRIRLLGYEKAINLRAEDVVGEDLSLRRFRYHYVIDGSELVQSGRIAGRTLSIEVATGKRPEQRTLELTGPVYPSSALTLIPVVEGLQVGSERRFTVYSGELQQLAEATQRVEAYEQSPLFEGAAFKVRTDLLGVATTSWIDAQGRPVLELGLDGVMVSALEEESAAKAYLAAAALNKDEAILEWSIVRADRAIPHPREVGRLRVRLEGARRAPPSSPRQQCDASAERATCDIAAARPIRASAVEVALGNQPSATVPSKDPMLRRLAAEIGAGLASPRQRIAAILRWMEVNIRKEPADVFSALDVLDSRRAECQGHAYLYAALARAAGIPTRVANGLVYSEEHAGFLFHSWAESVIDGNWEPVDPTFGQRLADATHITLVYGESMADLVPLLDWVGRTRAAVLETEPLRADGNFNPAHRRSLPGHGAP